MIRYQPCQRFLGSLDFLFYFIAQCKPKALLRAAYDLRAAVWWPPFYIVIRENEPEQRNGWYWSQNEMKLLHNSRHSVSNKQVFFRSVTSDFGMNKMHSTTIYFLLFGCGATVMNNLNTDKKYVILIPTWNILLAVIDSPIKRNLIEFFMAMRTCSYSRRSCTSMPGSRIWWCICGKREQNPGDHNESAEIRPHGCWYSMGLANGDGASSTELAGSKEEEEDELNSINCSLG